MLAVREKERVRERTVVRACFYERKSVLLVIICGCDIEQQLGKVFQIASRTKRLVVCVMVLISCSLMHGVNDTCLSIVLLTRHASVVD